jgi:hypothetical protein
MAIPAAAHRDIVVVGGHTEDLSIWPHSGYGYLSCSFSVGIFFEGCREHERIYGDSSRNAR